MSDPLSATRPPRQTTTQRSHSHRQDLSEEDDTAQALEYQFTAVRKDFEATVARELGNGVNYADSRMLDTFDESASSEIADWRLAVLRQIETFMEEDNGIPNAQRHRQIRAGGSVDFGYHSSPNLNEIFKRTGGSGEISADRSQSEVLDETQDLMKSMAAKRREWDAISALNPAPSESSSDWPFTLMWSGLFASAFLLPAGARWAARGLRSFVAGKEEARALKSLGRSLVGSALATSTD